MTIDREKYVRAQVTLKAKTDDAILISFNDDEEQEWVPRSTLNWECEKNIFALRRNEEFELRVAAWMADKIGLRY